MTAPKSEDELLEMRIADVLEMAASKVTAIRIVDQDVTELLLLVIRGSDIATFEAVLARVSQQSNPNDPEETCSRN